MNNHSKERLFCLMIQASLVSLIVGLLVGALMGCFISNIVK
jgi:hypothetical protein